MASVRGQMFWALVLSLVVVAAACERNTTTVEEYTTIEEISTTEVCFECHSDQDYTLLWAESLWENSKHASGDNIDRNYSSCVSCHTHEGFISSVTGEDVSAANPSTIQCFTCHAPHENSNFALRVTEPQSLMDGVSYNIGAGNLCVSCHHARRDVNTYVVTSNDTVEMDDHWGPHHSVQGDMLFGSNGYEYDGYTYGQTSHRGATSDGCIDCHFKESSMNVLGGHSFNMAYLEEGGDEEDEMLNTAACYDCHGDLDDFNKDNVQEDVDSLLHHLEGQLEVAGLIEDGHPAERIVASSDSAGAVWNYIMIEEDRSRGIHNPDYIIDLLESAIKFMDGTLLPAPAQYAEKIGKKAAK